MPNPFTRIMGAFEDYKRSEKASKLFDFAGDDLVDQRKTFTHTPPPMTFSDANVPGSGEGGLDPFRQWEMAAKVPPQQVPQQAPQPPQAPQVAQAPQPAPAAPQPNPVQQLQQRYRQPAPIGW